MPGLFTTLATAANSLNAFEKSLETVSNNVNNVNTPGYAKQRLQPVSDPFDPMAGLSGGISPGPVESSRSEYAERAVWRNNSSYGQSDETSSNLSSIEPLFDVTGESGVPAAMNLMFQTFSSWSLSPNDTVARQAVINQADAVAQTFNQISSGLTNASVEMDDKIRSAVSTINNLASQIASINVEIRANAGSGGNAAVDTRLHNALESLSEYTNYTALFQPDGSVQILLNGETSLVFDDQAYTIGTDSSGGTTMLLDQKGNDITDQVRTGRLRALLDMKNTTVPGYQAELNQLAASFADGINNTLAAGVDANGNPGAPLFAYNAPEDAAFSIRVADISTAELAAAKPGAEGGNGNALDLTTLANSIQINGMTYTQAYSQIATQVGQKLSESKDATQTRKDLLVQAQSMRSDLSAVSLDEEAALMMEYQRAYQANSRLISVLNDLTQSTIDMMR